MMATVAAAAGLVLPDNAGRDSVNQLPVFLDPAVSARDTVITQYTYKSGPGCPRSIRDGKWKLIDGKDGGDMLFDLEKDIGEKNNLIKDKKEEAARLRALLKRITGKS